MSFSRIFLLLGLLLSAPLKAQVDVAVGIEPMRYLLEQLGGERVRASTLLSGGDPHALDPTPAQLLALKKADLYFAVGLPFELSLGRRLGRAEQLVWLAEPAEAHDEHAEHAEEHAGHGHTDHADEHAEAHVDGLADTHAQAPANESGQGDDHGHAHGDGLDPHRWAAPGEMLRMGARVTRELQRVDAAGHDYYAERYARFETDVQQLQRDIRAALGQDVGAFVAVHPAWGWFAAEFSLQQLSVEHEGKLPSIRQMSALKKRVAASGARYVVSEHGGQQAQALAERLGLELLLANPLSHDWPAALRALASGLGSR